MFRIDKIKQFPFTEVIYSSNEVRTLLYSGEPVAHAAYGVCWLARSAKKLEEDSEISKVILWFLNTFKYMWDHNNERIIYGNCGGREAINRLSITI
jgi:hypothetical protein